jgi:hypothetical protein
MSYLASWLCVGGKLPVVFDSESDVTSGTVAKTAHMSDLHSPPCVIGTVKKEVTETRDTYIILVASALEVEL